MSDAKEIFGSQLKNTTTINLSTCSCTWSGNGLNGSETPIFLTDITIQYQQQSTPMYDLTGKGKLVIKGAPVGTMTCTGAIAENKANLSAFISAVAAPCKDKDHQVNMVLTPGQDCAVGDTATNSLVKYTLDGIDMDAITIQLQAGQQGVAVLNQRLNFSFTGLRIE